MDPFISIMNSTRPRRTVSSNAFLEVKLVGFDLNLIALEVIYNFTHPLPGQFHYCFTQRGVLWDIHNG